MGNYDRTLNAIAAKKEKIAALRAVLEDTPWEEHDAIQEEIYNLEIEIGEAEGYLEELAGMDGYDSYEEYEEDEMTWRNNIQEGYSEEFDEYDETIDEPGGFYDHDDYDDHEDI